jgi:hypothetical protein
VSDFRLCGLVLVVVENVPQDIPIAHKLAGFKDRSGYGDMLIDTSSCLYDPDLFLARRSFLGDEKTGNITG